MPVSLLAVIAAPAPDSADHDATVCTACANGLTHRRGEVGIIHRLRGVSTQVQELVFVLQRSDQVLLQRVSGVIGAECNSRTFLLR